MSSKRTAIGNKKRFDVFKRDGFTCQYCGAHPPQVVLELDHVTPVSKGGGNEIENLLTACFNCNRGKRDHLLSSAPQSLADKAVEVREREAQLAGYAEVMAAKRDRLEREMWAVAVAIKDDAEKGFRRDHLQSIKRFLERLPFDEVMEAAEIARAAKPYSDRQCFLYFCGICWNKIRRNEGTDVSD